MRLSEFDFDLPEALIATRPAQPRTSSRLLVADRTGISDDSFAHLGKYLRPGDRLVLNDTKVLPARLSGERVRQTSDGSGRAAVEVTLMSPTDQGLWRVMARPLRKLKAGDVIDFSGLRAEVVERGNDDAMVRFLPPDDETLDQALDRVGRMPLPPYIESRRKADARDRQDYQTVFARETGAVAAPTASLHFDQPLLDRLEDMGVGLTKVTLHVGAGTFLPVKVDRLDDHVMHAERGVVSARAAEEMATTRSNGGRVIPVGTTALRLIETAARAGEIAPWSGETDIFIRPGFTFRATDALITNFHLPKSTLIVLVAALIGIERTRAVYDHAIANRYRFFSYGDSSLLIP